MKVLFRVCMLLAALSLIAFANQTSTSELSKGTVPQAADVQSQRIQEMKAKGLYDQAIWDEYYGTSDQTRRGRELIDVGGDVISSCTNISSLPYTDIGNTCSYTNDYDEVCPYGGSTSPDVVYCFRPTANICADLSLCNTGTDYDTKLYVYQGSYTPGSPFACNDDACPGYYSQLLGLQLTGGTIYYIVVDGYGGACGNYALSLVQVNCPPALPTCPANSLAGQRPAWPSESWTAGTSDLRAASTYGPLLRYESFSGVTQPICDLHFWGLSLNYNNGWYLCNEDPMTFDVKFYNDNNGMPGTVACTYTLTLSRQAAGYNYGSYPLWKWETTLNPCCTLSNGWLSIQGTSVGTPTDCWFLWMSSPSGNGSSLLLSGGVISTAAFDLNYCLTPNICEFQYLENDYGDLSMCNYPTLFCNPSHGLSGIAWLGAGVTGDAYPNILNLDQLDDGVIYNNLPWMPCTYQSVTVTVTAGPNYPFYAMHCDEYLYLNGWKDGNLDGDFCDVLCYTPGAPAAPEWIVQDVPVVPGVYNFTFIDPGVLNMGVYDGIFRWRLTHIPVGAFGFGWVNQDTCPTMTCGTYSHDMLGEVEDYIIHDMQLSVELQSFVAVAGDGQVSLQWTTASETNNDHFVLYKRASGVENFTNLAEIPGNGTTSQQHSYQYIDQSVVNGITYEYQIADVDINGVEIRHDIIVSATPEAVNTIPTEYALYQNYPNPFNPITTIGFDIKETGNVTLKVFDLLGREVATLVNGEMTAGSHTITWDASGMSSGIYVYRIEAGNFKATNKMLFLK